MARSSVSKTMFPKLRLIVIAAAALTVAPTSAANAQSGNQTAIFAGGCFLGVEAVFEHVKGVRGVVSGYAGGPAVSEWIDRRGRRAKGLRKRFGSPSTPRRLATTSC